MNSERNEDDKSDLQESLKKKNHPDSQILVKNLLRQQKQKSKCGISGRHERR